ncbi:hypothetical protein BH11ARM1_BH11ARM1_01870 [soil metagenome]
MQQYAFVHCGPNTFTDKEWGEGVEDPKLFNPTALDCRQWVKVFKDAGMTGVMITAKHHDGFCLWPSKFSTHTVAQSPWRDGKGDVLRELSDACKAEGMKMGVYLSPWDRNHPTYGTSAYNQVFVNMLKEVLTNYGPIFEVWFDGANGEGPNGKKQVYDWPLFIKTVRECQPNAVIFSDAGPDIRWVGNESGHSAPTCWSTIDRDRYVPGTPLSSELTEGKEGGKDWVPAECDVSIRPGWFYHANEDSKVKSPQDLLKLFEESLGQNGSFLLNVPPDRRGLINEADIASLSAFRTLRDKVYAFDLGHGIHWTATSERGKEFSADNLSDSRPSTYWAATDDATDVILDGTLPAPVTFDRVSLAEPIELGQRISQFSIQAMVDGEWKVLARETTVGARRIVRVPTTTTTQLRIMIDGSRACPALRSIGLFKS